MNRPCTLLAALLLPLCASAADQVWRADLSSTEVRNLYLRHGESADLVARLYLHGRAYNPTNAVAYYQTNGMAQAWWSAPCSIASNTVTVAWTPQLDPGADLVSMLIRLDDSAYRAAAMLYLRPSPGAEPNILPAPTQWLDFDKIAWTNAPWALATDIPTNFVPATGGSFLSTNVFMPTRLVDGAVGTATGTGVAYGAPAVPVVPAGETVTLRLDLLDATWDVVTNVYTEFRASVSIDSASIHKFAEAEFIGSGPGYGTDAFGGTLQIDPWNGRWYWFKTFIGHYVDGGTLELQSGKPGGFSRLATVDQIPALDYSATNTALVATIQAVAPAPGDYATVSNRAMTALQSFTETDPTVPSWAKDPSKPTYTATEVGAAAASHQHAITDVTNFPALAQVATSGSYADLSGKPAIPTIPTVVSAFSNDVGYLSAYTETDPTVPAWAKAENPPSGGADMDDVSNLVAQVVSEAGASAAATETWRIVLADHQRRLDALEDSDGTDALTEAQAEQLIQNRMDTLLHDIEEEWGDTSGCIPIQTTTCNSTTISENTSGVASNLSPLYATRYYASTANNRTLGFSSFSGVGNNPCILILERFSSVSWPSGACIETAYSYNSGNPNVYAVYKLNGTIYAKKIYP